MIASPHYGLGSAGTQAVQAGAPLAVPVAIWIGGAAAGPIGLAVAGLITLGASIASALHVGEGCGPTCVQATSVVNQAEPTFRMNLDGYETGAIDQQTAVNNFHGMWTAIEQACGAIPGVAGQNCTGDRKAGACKWKQTAQPMYPGQPQQGECWNWWNAYYDPLLQPPINVSTSSLVSAAGGGSTILDSVSSSLGGVSPLILGLGIIALGVAVG